MRFTLGTSTTNRSSVSPGSVKTRVSGELAGYTRNFPLYDHFSSHWGGKSPLLK